LFRIALLCVAGHGQTPNRIARRVLNLSPARLFDTAVAAEHLIQRSKFANGIKLIWVVKRFG
jgi:hypothetical protein